MAHTAASPTQSPTKTWGFGAPEKINFSDPQEVTWSEAAKFSDERVKVIAQITQILRQEEEQFVGKERAFLENTIKFLDTFYHKAKEFVAEEEHNIEGIKADIQSHAKQQEQFAKEIEALKAGDAEIEQRIAGHRSQQQTYINRIGELSNLVNPVELSKIKIANASEASNVLFSWVWQVVYQRTRETYDWNAFKKVAFADKGKDFSARLRGLNANTLKRADFISARSVVDRKDELLQPLEPKGKENVSARRLIDYIANIAEIGTYHDHIVAENQQVEEKHVALAKKEVEAEGLAKHIKPLEEKVSVSNQYIDTLKNLLPSVDEFIVKVKARVNIQDQYIETLRGNIQEIDPMAQSVFQTKHGHSGHEEAVHEHSPQEHQRNTALGQEECAGAHEEQTLQGDADDLHNKKSLKSAPQVDLKESEFANSKRVGCESCSMF